MPESTIRLTEEQIAFYHANGYLSIPALTTLEEVERFRVCYDDMFTRKVGREAGDQFDLGGTDEDGKEPVLPQILGFHRFIPDFTESLLVANATAVTRQLLGDGAGYRGGHAIYKPPHIGAATPWHQDEAYWGPAMEHRSLSIWVPLQQATPENGCMHFIPGSHLHGIYRHQSINNDPRIHGLELTPDEMHRIANIAACPLPAGGATIHDQRTLHFTPPNRSDVPRRACILMGGHAPTPAATPISKPWLDEKQTARATRAKAARVE